MNATTTYGRLMDYATGEYVREATEEERAASDAEVAAGRDGAIIVDWRREGGWHGEDYRRCWVDPS